MSNIDNLDKVIIEIKKLLLKNEEFRKLLKYNTPDALELAAPTKSDVADLIKTTPAIYMTEDDDSNQLTNFVVIYVPVINLSAQQNDITYIIDVFTKKEILELNNNKLRLHRMVSNAYNTLDNQRISLTGRLSVTTATYVTMGTAYVGYQIELSVIDEAVENEI